MSLNLANSINFGKFTGILQDHFDLFSSGKMLIVHKEPRRVITNVNADSYAGYGPISNETNVTLVPVSGAFPVVRLYSKESEHPLREFNTTIPGGTVRVKVERDARDYIKDGKNEYFELEGFTFNEAQEETPQNYLGKVFYRFTLKRTQ